MEIQMHNYAITNRAIGNVLGSWIQSWNYQPTWNEIIAWVKTEKNVLHFAEAEILKPNNSPDLDCLILIDSGVAIDNDFDLLRVSGDWCTLDRFILTDWGVATDNAFDLLRVSGEWRTLNLREI